MESSAPGVYRARGWGAADAVGETGRGQIVRGLEAASHRIGGLSVLCVLTLMAGACFPV